MNISKKWQVATAAAIAIALVGGGSTAANAAPGDIINPQPAGSAQEGSKGGFYLYDGNTGEFADGNPARVYTRDEGLISSASATDVLGEINPAATRPVTGAATFTGVYRFLAAKNTADVVGGTNTWNSYAVDAASGPNGGTLTADFALDAINNGPGGIADDIAAGGSYWYGVAYTINNGVTVVGAVYREINITAGSGNYTVSPWAVETGPTELAPAITANPVSDLGVHVGDVKTLTADATGTPTPDVQWESSSDGTTFGPVAGATSKTLTVPTTVTGTTHYRAKFTNTVDSATTTAAQVTVTAAITEPTSPANDATKQTIVAPVDGTVTLTGVAAGTYTAYAWSTPINLGTVVVPASGIATIPVPAALQDGAAHTFALLQADNSVVAWGNVLVPAPEFPLTDTTQLSADVIVSGKFALEGVNAGPIPLGTAKRGATTAAVPLGAFTVTDDRDDLKGWTLNAAVAEFANATGATIPGTALGLAPKKVGTPVAGISTLAPKVAGDTWTSTLVAEGIAGSYTPELGTQFDADLTFKAPANAKKGTYTSTLTLTLASK